MTVANVNRRPQDGRSRRSIWAGLALTGVSLGLAACGGSAGSSNATDPPAAQTSGPSISVGTSTAPSSSDVVLPVTSNPISNTSTDELLTIDSVLVENNIDISTGKDAGDHLEIAVTNNGNTGLVGFEVFYTITDSVTGDTESYYAALPEDFTVAAGASRTIHFDDTGAVDHFPDNPYSLYHSSLNGLDVTVEVSATGAAPQTMTVQKDPGGDEVAD